MITLHTGSCAAAPRAPSETARTGPQGAEYCLHDSAGRAVGTIPAPVVRPYAGSSAPTFYLRRSR